MIIKYSETTLGKGATCLLVLVCKNRMNNLFLERVSATVILIFLKRQSNFIEYKCICNRDYK